MRFTSIAMTAVVLTLAACAQPEPEPVYVQPTYDKLGNPSCYSGYQLATTPEGQMVCAPVS
ncbi:hypothetical protein [Ruegeria marina]|uniref:Hemolysin n=1 Tax=Ruegeria marina TaxID=639004 RepID=A0A1G6JU34_9RHOB|nr:hypothetical protein [Ruegeria marina]SDC22213.1 hypothetical protein SAMN04488239_101438 [Ruegeria marina]